MNEATLLLRQIHPSFVQDKRPSSQALRPTPKDEKKLSVYDCDQIIDVDGKFDYMECAECYCPSCGKHLDGREEK